MSFLNRSVLQERAAAATVEKHPLLKECDVPPNVKQAYLQGCVLAVLERDDGKVTDAARQELLKFGKSFGIPEEYIGESVDLVSELSSPDDQKTFLDELVASLCDKRIVRYFLRDFETLVKSNGLPDEGAAQTIEWVRQIFNVGKNNVISNAVCSGAVVSNESGTVATKESGNVDCFTRLSCLVQDRINRVRNRKEYRLFAEAKSSFLQDVDCCECKAEQVEDFVSRALSELKERLVEQPSAGVVHCAWFCWVLFGLLYVKRGKDGLYPGVLVDFAGATPYVCRNDDWRTSISTWLAAIFGLLGYFPEVVIGGVVLKKAGVYGCERLAKMWAFDVLSGHKWQENEYSVLYSAENLVNYAMEAVFDLNGQKCLDEEFSVLQQRDELVSIFDEIERRICVSIPYSKREGLTTGRRLCEFLHTLGYK